MNKASLRRRVAPRRNLVVILLVVLIAGGCGGPYAQSAMQPASETAQQLQDLFAGIFWWAVAVFVIVEGALVLTVLKFRARRGQDQSHPPKHVHGNTIIELAWTLAPAVVLVMIAVPTIATIWEVDRPTTDPDALVVEVVGHQWWWEFRYPELGIVTANEFHIPVGQTIDLRLTSADVIHSFWIPRLAGKRDVVPGRENFLWFAADSVGTFIGQCAEFCGLSHALMKLEVVVDPPAVFEDWVTQQGIPAGFLDAGDPLAALAKQGENVFMRAGCIACHRIDGTPAQGVLGPDLSHVGSRRTIAAGILENTPPNMERWLQDPVSIKPGALMPNLQLAEQDVRSLAAYLSSLQ
ncbi:MAG: cytochrome c oxidase subunit II [Gemmatimonadales bacterium]|nr:MAG: cytochrome c oxidase subunit II [Gemmatimonadales bacterium]